MPAYRITTRIVEIDADYWSVAATAAITTAPRQAVITRQHQCASRDQAVDFLEILVDQVRAAIEATGGEVVAVTTAD